MLIDIKNDKGKLIMQFHTDKTLTTKHEIEFFVKCINKTIKDIHLSNCENCLKPFATSNGFPYYGNPRRFCSDLCQWAFRSRKYYWKNPKYRSHKLEYYKKHYHELIEKRRQKGYCLRCGNKNDNIEFGHTICTNCYDYLKSSEEWRR